MNRIKKLLVLGAIVITATGYGSTDYLASRGAVTVASYQGAQQLGVSKVRVISKQKINSFFDSARNAYGCTMKVEVDSI